MNKDAKLRRSDKATFQSVAGEAVLIHVETGEYFSLNEVGTDFWELLDGETSIAQHGAELAKNYEVTISVIVGDLVELASELAKDQLVEMV